MEGVRDLRDKLLRLHARSLKRIASRSRQDRAHGIADLSHELFLGEGKRNLGERLSRIPVGRKTSFLWDTNADVGTTPPPGVVAKLRVTAKNTREGNATEELLIQNFVDLISQTVRTEVPEDTATKFGFPLAVADFDNDSFSDAALVVPSAIAGRRNVQVFRGQSDGRLVATTTFDIGTGPEPQLVARDVTNDGIVDLLCGSTKTVTTFRGDGAGGFVLRSTLPPPDALQLAGFAVADFTSDGVPDVAVLDDLSYQLCVFRGTGDGTFALAVTTPLTAFGKRPIPVVTLDFDRDGVVDLAFGDSEGQNAIRLLRGRG
jgi:hypothetical protein